MPAPIDNNFQGGISIGSGTANIANTTISGNIGGGIAIYSNFGSLTVRHSTITGNGAGIHAPNGGVTLDHTIVAGNGANDFFGSVFANHSLIGICSEFLGPLAENGGPTKTHALLPGSPAIDAGDPAALAGVGGVPLFDQRDFAFSRVAGGRIDIGAFELQAAAPSADFDDDDDVDGSDFLAWQRGLGLTGAAATRANGNADGDGDVDGDDLAAWKAQFGLAQGALASEDHPSLALPLKGRGPEDSMAGAADAVFAVGDFTQLFAEHGSASRRKWRPPRRVG
jgi:hypothetical protein